MTRNRVVNEHSLHTEYNPSLCKRGIEPCGIARCIDRHGTLKDYITVECSKCGEQKDVPDFFDEEYS